jgi:hypothetical protein
LTATEKLYHFDIASYNKDTLGRSKHEFSVLVPHEELDASLRDDPTFSVRLDEAISNNELPKAYFDHPIVKASSEPVAPFSLFADGVPYSITDSVVGFWLINEITAQRFLIAALRKKCVALVAVATGVPITRYSRFCRGAFGRWLRGGSPIVAMTFPHGEKRTRLGQRCPALQ